MAGFKTHISVSTLTGIGYGSAAFTLYNVPLPTCLLAGGLCSVSGMLPDVDSDSGVPRRESLAFGAAVIPMMLIDRLQRYNLATETIVLAGALMYLLVRFGFGKLLKQCSVHRGMFHSIPAACVAAELAFLLASGGLELRVFKAGAVLLGYLSHLLLDEIWSIEWTGYFFRRKKSFGTALKLWGSSMNSNLVTYAGAGLLALLIFQDHSPSRLPNPAKAAQTAEAVIDNLVR
ncbi:MAG: hypothetical protein A2W31_17395 [Planctomycetes bacterium RBG_16_64_10]|nr:MAG: hypothetical protein A2W31_17395 [Planctomycetes bacterium RBG_16_64_10]